MSIQGCVVEWRGAIGFLLVVDQGKRACRRQQRPNSHCIAIQRSKPEPPPGMMGMLDVFYSRFASFVLSKAESYLHTSQHPGHELHGRLVNVRA